MQSLFFTVNNNTKYYNMRKRNYVYDYEITPKRKFLDRLETFINYSLAFTTIGAVLFIITLLVSLF